MDDVVLCRHGESETAAAGVVGGDAPLTARGRTQALELGRALGQRPLDACLVSPARRALETADIALAGRGLRAEVVPELADIRFGEFEGGRIEEYRAWIAAHAPDQAPAGGESRAETLRRFGYGFRKLLDRHEAHLIVVAHGLTLTGLTDDPPRPVVAGVPYGSTLTMTRAELAAALARLERWCEAPGW